MTRGTCGAVALAAFLTGMASVPAQAGVDRALANFKAGRYLEAASELQAVVDRTPGYDYGYFLLGHCMLKMGKPAEAEAHFRQALEIQPVRPEYYEGLALALKAEAKWVRTIAASTDGLGHAQDARTRYALLALRGYAWGALQRWDEAIQDLDAARRIRPEPWVLVMLGKAYFNSGAFFSAVPTLRAALQHAQDDPTILRMLAESFIRLAGDDPDMAKKKLLYLQALPYAQHLTSVAPDDLTAVNLVGRAALGAGRLEEAEGVFQLVLMHDPHQCYAMANLGRTYLAAQRFDDAEAFLRKAVACAPRMAVAYQTLGDMYLSRGLTQEAAEAYRHAEEIEPTERDPNVPDPGQRNAPGTIPVSGRR